MSLILGPDGRPIQQTRQEFNINGGWVLTGGIGQTPMADVGPIYGVNRQLERRKARIAFFTNHVIEGAINVLHAFTFGDQFSYGEIEDQTIKEITEDFLSANNFEVLVERWGTEFLVDGENATLFPLSEDDPGRNVPAMISFADVDRSLALEADALHGVTSIRVGGVEGLFTPERFVWTAHQALWNDPRGWPVIMRAVDPAVAYVNLLNHRLRVHDLQARINAVYTALVDYSQGSTEAEKQHKRKSDMYGFVPKDGAVVTLAKDRETGQAETLEFTNPGRGALDAEKDARLLRLAVAVAIGIPEHYLGEGGNVNKSTSEAMGEPAKRAFSRRQSVARSWLDRMLRLEVKRRLGPDATV